MTIFLAIVGVLGWLFGVFAMSNSQSAVHEIEALIAFLLGTVAFGLGGVIDSVRDLRKAMIDAAVRPTTDAGTAPAKPQLDWLGRPAKR